jgi:NADH-quinone oxidoreductase subunit M
MGFVTVGIFALNKQAVSGAIFQMLSHGVVSGALFLCVGVVYDRMHSREISTYGGLVHRMPKYATVFMLFALASVGLPGTSGFVGETLVMVGAFQDSTWVAALIALGVILSAAYMLYLYRRVIFGALVKDELKTILDLNRTEIMVFAPLVLVVIWMGIWPMHFLDPIAASVNNLIEQYQTALAATGGSVLVAR